MSLTIREVRPEEYAEVGRLIVDAYASLPGMPTRDEQPEYYARLLDVARRAGNPAIHVFVAFDHSGAPLGSVDFIEDMKHYGAAGPAGNVPDAAGVRLLAVRAEARGQGLGKALTEFCIARARELGKTQVVLHTTHAMQTAWALYERLGFVRFPELDFRQGNLDVFGFRLALR
jgi:ribosomal protein S18 acetylase RimI-like enzyme